ncbi:unnamed protein product [Prorocentrum cordatum]|uniref:Uncharacterized protein n=1 Tax=Prorocentrum cordatum TaxID=2364126 RepID=A0ABN9W763_9DINO|nr:unnamed protein product [Polarella glacialis]
MVTAPAESSRAWARGPWGRAEGGGGGVEPQLPGAVGHAAGEEGSPQPLHSPGRAEGAQPEIQRDRTERRSIISPTMTMTMTRPPSLTRQRP